MKQPYREPAPIHIDPPPRDPADYILAFVGLCLVFGICAVGYRIYTHKAPPPLPCSEMAEVPAKDLPARCTKTYNPDGGAS